MHEVDGWKVWGPAELGTWIAAAKERMDLVLPLCKQRRVAIDVGANIGVYTNILFREFRSVIAYEPHPRNFECLCYNRDRHFKYGRPVEMFECGLSDREEFLSLDDKYGGISAFVTKRLGEIPLLALDDSIGSRREIDFIKVDAEGYDLKALKGAEKTIVRCKPIIMVENKPDLTDRNPDWYTGRQIPDYMDALGYELIHRLPPDEIYKPR